MGSHPGGGQVVAVDNARHGLVFVGPGHGEHHEAGTGDAGKGQAETKMSIPAGGVNVVDHESVRRREEAFRTGEQGSGVAVRAESEVDEVKSRAGGNDRLVGLGRRVTIHGHKARAGLYPIDERLADHVLIGVGVVGRQAPLVADETLD
jgi:hypothetical protein